MFLTDDEMRLVREAVEVQAGFDNELIKRCSYLIHIQAFDEAVRNAFVLLEERLRKVLQKEAMTGFQMIQFAFSANGPFTKLLSHNQLEMEGSRDLFAGAFRLFRNPAAHTVVGYSAGEARSVISLIDLLLKRLDKLAEMPQPGTLPNNAEQVLLTLEKAIGVQGINRVRTFLTQCVKLGIQPRSSTKQWVPFRKYALVKHEHWKEPKPHPVTLFYLLTTSKEQGLWVPLNQYYAYIVNFNSDHLAEDLKGLGFQPTGQYQDYYISLNSQNSQAMFDALLRIVTRTAREFDDTLRATK